MPKALLKQFNRQQLIWIEEEGVIMEMASIVNQYYDAFMIKYGDTALYPVI